MKPLVLAALAVLCLPSLAAAAETPKKQPAPPAQTRKGKAAPAKAAVTQIEVDGEKFFATQAIPPELLGVYQYEDSGQLKPEPGVELGANNRGYFQPHGSPRIPIQYWMEANAAGEVQRQFGATGAYVMVVIVKYLEGYTGNYPKDGTSRMQVIVAPDMGKVMFLGERVKSLPAGFVPPKPAAGSTAP